MTTTDTPSARQALADISAATPAACLVAPRGWRDHAFVYASAQARRTGRPWHVYMIAADDPAGRAFIAAPDRTAAERIAGSHGVLWISTEDGVCSR